MTRDGPGGADKDVAHPAHFWNTLLAAHDRGPGRKMDVPKHVGDMQELSKAGGMRCG